MCVYNTFLKSFQREFGFDDSDDDMFSDMGLRSRMNRMGHPFDWGRKRRGSTGHTEPQPNAYDQYFPDEPDFAGFGSPHWDTFNTARKRNQHPTADRSGFFDYLPPEFRQYIPDNFGFSNMRQHPPMTPRSPPSAAFQKPPHPQQQQQQQYPPQQYPPQFQQQQAVPTSPKPNLCDAAIQTEDIDNKTQTQGNNLQQHGLRNTVDLGQKSQQEEVRTDRAHSAPPREDLLAQQKNIQPVANAPTNTAEDTGAANSGFSNAGTSMTPQCNIKQPQFNAAVYQQQKQQQEQQRLQQEKQQQQHQRPTAPSTSARTVPIFVEGRNVPLVNKINIPQETCNQQPQPHQTTKPQNRPAPFIAKENVPQETSEQQQIPPQTPHTTDCINKIQDIQRDVLDLMGKVERFGGLKGDKEYMYLDEMLTRNLLKLDTIDTNGKESIRLARKEAIKCIQASIAVLDAKSEINAKPKEKQNENADESLKAVEASGDNISNKENTTESTEDQTKTVVSDDAVETPATHVSEIQINLGDQPLNETSRKLPENENSQENGAAKETDEKKNEVDDVKVAKEQ